jgi:BirA family transcriptional regulator, biotin operon repressor / biotin---[acetyl-CoA-carboxylase] ligase
VSDLLDERDVQPLLQGLFGRPYRYAEETESTQDLLVDDDPHGAVAAANVQTKGRGRLGRTWEAPAGKALLFSVLVRPPAGRKLPELSLVAGIAVADALEETLGLNAQIKWPNDVLVNRKKVAGILAEARGDAVVIGIGINVNQTRDELPLDDDDVETRAASLFTTDGETRERAPLLARVLARFEHHYKTWADGGLDDLYIDLGSRDFLRGRRVSINGTTGTAVQIDREGRLEVEVDGGGHELVESGEVVYER